MRLFIAGLEKQFETPKPPPVVAVPLKKEPDIERTGQAIRMVVNEIPFDREVIRKPKVVDVQKTDVPEGETPPQQSAGGACQFCGKFGKDGKRVSMLHVKHCHKNPNRVPHHKDGQRPPWAKGTKLKIEDGGMYESDADQLTPEDLPSEMPFEEEA